ncbi:unique hypothetical protein [Mycoplasmoides gallisepticum str. R(low)]|uniref:Uncharacterized protein n=1 Tax=Mycoplasmoides gallisepticum (strain R(low / passage 15 / clone 2)) TaxID=710127 RepID=D3DEI5_MYCGA|nr:unique hypothetical protein [Mycoplasmoides gallisepticum str. R(low)]ADC30401.1 hypothetical protein MGAH_1343 [Mycoplasmoides gallisepticum str. R(high)]
MHALWKIKRNLSFLPLNIKIFIYVNNNSFKHFIELKKELYDLRKNISFALDKLKNKARQIPYKHFCKLSCQLKQEIKKVLKFKRFEPLHPQNANYLLNKS